MGIGVACCNCAEPIEELQKPIEEALSVFTGEQVPLKRDDSQATLNPDR